jgi:hypothetical protein
MVISYVNFYTINIDYAVADEINQESQVTEHEPKARISDLKDLPKGKSGNWLWAILVSVAIAGGVAAMAGGGGGGGGGGGDDNTGSVGGSW